MLSEIKTAVKWRELFRDYGRKGTIIKLIFVLTIQMLCKREAYQGL